MLENVLGSQQNFLPKKIHSNKPFSLLHSVIFGISVHSVSNQADQFYVQKSDVVSISG